MIIWTLISRSTIPISIARTAESSVSVRPNVTSSHSESIGRLPPTSIRMHKTTLGDLRHNVSLMRYQNPLWSGERTGLARVCCWDLLDPEVPAGARGAEGYAEVPIGVTESTTFAQLRSQRLSVGRWLLLPLLADTEPKKRLWLYFLSQKRWLLVLQSANAARSPAKYLMSGLEGRQRSVIVQS